MVEEGKKEDEEEKKEEAAEDFETRLKYLAAEFDNFRKRAAKERREAGQSAVEKLVAEMLPVLDDFDATMKTLQENNADKKTVDGIVLVYKKLLKTLEARGLKKIATAGEKFDVGLHEAAGFEEGDGEDGVVAREVQAGYKVGNAVVRHAKVIVAKRKESENAGKENTQQ